MQTHTTTVLKEIKMATTVYVLSGVVQYEYSEVLGVYHTYEDAEKARDEYKERIDGDEEASHYDVYEFQHIELGKSATTSFERGYEF